MSIEAYIQEQVEGTIERTIAYVNEDVDDNVAGFADADEEGGADENSQTFTFNITNNTNPSLFQAGPAIAPNGTLTFTPTANAFGTADITVTAQDSGGGDNTSDPRTFTITVRSSNDAPTVDLTGNVDTTGLVRIAETDAGEQTITDFADPDVVGLGGTDESGQSVLSYTVAKLTGIDMLDVEPAINTANGNM